MLASFIQDYKNPHFENIPDQFVGQGIDSAESSSAYVLDLLTNSISFVLELVVVAALVIIAASGIRYIIATGNEEQVEHAKKTLLYGILGMLIAIFSWTIVTIISKGIIEKATNEQVYIVFTQDYQNPKHFDLEAGGIPADTISNVLWEIDGDETMDTGTATNVSIVYDSPGSHEVKVTVKANVDGSGEKEYTASEKLYVPSDGEVLLIISEPNGSTIYPKISNVDTSIVDHVAWVWDTGESPDASQTGLEATHTYSSSGEKQVIATVYFTDGTNQSVSQNVDIKEGSLFTIESVVDEFNVDFSITGGINPQKISNILWDFGDGTDAVSNTTPNMSYTYPKSGEYVVKVDIDYTTGEAFHSEAPVRIDVIPELSCAEEDMDVTCTLSKVQTPYVERIEYFATDDDVVVDMKVPDVDGEASLTFNWFYAPNPDPYYPGAKIYYKDGAVEETATTLNMEGEEVSLSVQGEGYEVTFVVENFPPDYVDKIELSPYGSTPGTGSSIVVFQRTGSNDSEISGGHFEYDYFYDRTGVFGESSAAPVWAKVTFDNPAIEPRIAQLDSSNAVSINDPEPQLTHSYNASTRRLRLQVNSLDDYSEVHRYKYYLNERMYEYNLEIYEVSNLPPGEYDFRVVIVYKPNASQESKTITATYDQPIIIPE